MKASDVKDKLAALVTKCDTSSVIYAILNDSTKASKINEVSDHTYYGLPDSCLDDITTCIYILSGIERKLNKVTS